MVNVIENFNDFLGDYRAFYWGKWSILVEKQKHNQGLSVARARARAPYNNVTKSKSRKFLQNVKRNVGGEDGLNPRKATNNHMTRSRKVSPVKLNLARSKSCYSVRS